MKTLYWAMLKSADEWSRHVNVPWKPKPIRFVTCNEALCDIASSSLSKQNNFPGTKQHRRHYSTSPNGKNSSSTDDSFDDQNFSTAASATYGKRLMSAVRDKSLFLKNTSLQCLQAGLSLQNGEIQEAHERAMEFAENSVNLKGKPYTSEEGIKALDELDELETILGTTVDMPRLLNRLLNEMDP